MFTTWMGIDPGLKGGIAVQYAHQASRAIPIPTTDGKFDPPEISRMIDSLLDCDPLFGLRPTLVYIEDVHAMPGQGVTSMFNFGFGVGLLHGILAAKGLTVYRVNPIRWKNRVLKNRTKDKLVAIQYCLDNFPEVNLGKKPHDGMADALCISEYARWFHSENTTHTPRAARGGKRAAPKARRA